MSSLGVSSLIYQTVLSPPPLELLDSDASRAPLCGPSTVVHQEEGLTSTAFLVAFLLRSITGQVSSSMTSAQEKARRVVTIHPTRRVCQPY